MTTLEHYQKAAKLFELQFPFQIKLSPSSIEVATFKNGVHTFLLNDDSQDSAFETCAIAKTTEKYGAKITDLEFQPAAEESLKTMFINFTMPYRDALIYGIMKEYLSEDLFNKELDDIEHYYGQSHNIDTSTVSVFWTASLYYLLHTYRDKNLPIPDLLASKAYIVDVLDEAITIEPTPDLLCEIANTFFHKKGISSYFETQTQLYSFEYSKSFANHF